MGYAKILGGGEDGRYTIELDYGAATKAATLAALTELLAKIDTGIAEQQALNAIADAVEAEQRAKVLEAQQQVIDQTVGGLPPGSPKPDTTLYKFELLKLSKLQQKHAPMRLNLQALLFDRQQALKQVAKWTAFTPTETRQAWCADLTEDAPAGSYAATLEIPGESSLVLLAPGCRPWSAGDGVLTAREVMSPEQAFLNAALLPGWQKWLPTYRWGTATAVNRDANTMSVALAPAISSAQSLSVNQGSSLTGVPVTYMTCGANAFEVGDRVVVKFEGQNWASPRVIGFLDNPKACWEWPSAVYMRLKIEDTSTTANAARAFFSDIEMSTFGPRYTGAYSIAANTVAHQISLLAPSFSPAGDPSHFDDDFEIVDQGSSYGVLWTGISEAAYFQRSVGQGSSGRAPGLGREASALTFYCGGPTLTVTKQTAPVFGPFSLPGSYGSDGTPQFEYTAESWRPAPGSGPLPDISEEVIIGPSLAAWLASASGSADVLVRNKDTDQVETYTFFSASGSYFSEYYTLVFYPT